MTRKELSCSSSLRTPSTKRSTKRTRPFLSARRRGSNSLNKPSVSKVESKRHWSIFHDAWTFPDDDDDDDDAPTCKDYMLHFISFFWKFLFAFVPPTSLSFKIDLTKINIVKFRSGLAGGWLCFSVSILIIGVLTALIGDLATHVGE